MLRTRFTDLLGVQYPIQCGTMMFISDAPFVAACANAGIFACLASAMFPKEEDLVQEIRKLRDLTDRPFGVNISLFPALLPRPVEETLGIVSDQGIWIIETAGNNPGPYMDFIREKGFIHIHKCARVRDAVKAEGLGVSMVAVVGTECGGHPSMEDVTTLVMIPEVADRIKIPLIAGGGFCDGKTLISALAMGADAALMGTRFLNTEECRIHPSIKERLIQARETDTVIVQRSIGSPVRVLNNPWAQKVVELESKGATLQELMPYISGKRAGHAWVQGDEDAVIACGQVVGRTRNTLPVKDLVREIMKEGEETLERLSRLKGIS